MRRNAKVTLALGAAIAGASVASASVISGDLIYSDTFANTGGSAITLNGYSPNVVDAGGENWVSASAPAGSGATDAIFQIPAGGGLTSVTSPVANPLTTEDTNTITDAYLPVTILSGTEYDFTATVQVNTVNSGGHGAFMGFVNSSNFNSHNGPTVASNGIYGSTVYPDVGDGSAALSNLNPYALILARDSNTANDVTMFQGEGTGVGSINATDTSNQYNTYDMVLNTIPSQWVLTQYLNGTLEQTYTFSSNPSIGFIGIGDNRASIQYGSVSFTQLPEPASMAGLCLVSVPLMLRRRARAKAE